MRRYLALFVVVATMFLGAYLRSYQLSAPLADWHSWRQVDTASVAREYLKHGINLKLPTYHDLSSIPSGLDNPNGYRFVEFPIISAVHALLAQNYPVFTLVEWGRILSIISSTLTIAVIYLIMKIVSSPQTAVFASIVFATLPYNIFYGRVILPEPHLVLFSLLALYFFLRYWDQPKPTFALGYTVFLTLALLLKPTALIILFPMFFYVIATKSFRLISAFWIVLLTLVSLTPYGLWRSYMSAFPSGIPASSWLFNGNEIRFKGAWFRWLFGDRIARLILGYWGLVPLSFGLLGLGRKPKELAVVGGLVFGSLVYLSVIATGNVQHDYYQIQIIPALSMLLGVGIDYALSLKKGFAKIYPASILLVSYLLALALGWYDIRGYFNINNPAIVQAGERVDALTPQDALIIAPYQGDTAFLFQTNRRGWPIGGNINDKVKAGANYYVTTTRDLEYEEVKNTHTLVEETATYSLFKLD